ncbi:MAG: DUF1326 domain-containing protein [Verrucomicrobia bacterium]|nr:DUF1326 domain-containing protein [Verrucomicrobiota bacterium]
MSDVKTKWALEAEFLQACNCDYGCPCEFAAPPTLGYCEGMGAYKITRGHFGALKLDGLALGFAARWPKAIHEGGGTLQLYVDERATSEQRAAILTIASGQAGGLPFEILATTFSTVLEPSFVRFEFHLDGRNSRVRIGTGVNVAMAPIKNPVTGAPESVRISHETGFIFKDAECVSAEVMTVDAGPLKFSWPKKAGFVTRISYAN